MNYKFFIFLFLILINSCSINKTTNKVDERSIKSGFKNNGFALVYDDKLYKKKIISSKLDDRDLVVLQKNLKKGSTVKIKNNMNNKSIIVKVGKNSKYPNFNNSVITKRIATAIELDLKEPYIEITEILNNSSFVAKKAKTFEEEKKVANKAPVESISINDLSSNKKMVKKVNKNKFSYIIKIADFYFIDSANLMIERIKEETTVDKINLKSLSETNYRVFLGPFDDLITLKKTFNDINMLNFENIEIIKND